MKILVTISNNTKEIINVYSYDHYHDIGKTDEQIEDAIKSSQEKNVNWTYQSIEVPEEMVEAMKFLLGEEKYVATATIRGLKNKVQNCIEDLEDMKTELYNMSEYFEGVARDLQKFVKEQKEDE